MVLFIVQDFKYFFEYVANAVKAAKAATVFLRNGLSLPESMLSSSIEAANKGS